MCIQYRSACSAGSLREARLTVLETRVMDTIIT